MTVPSIKAENVYALVVGIEKYQAGSEYDLNGPANDALRFSDWLLDHDILPEHIYLFLSPLEQNQSLLSSAEAKGLTPSPATHDAIANTIYSKLTSENSRGDLLYIFWGGHGIITKTDATVRRLFFADTDDDTKWNLNVNSLAEALSTAAYGAGFARQILFIDACANAFYQGLAQTIQGDASGIRFATSGDDEQAEQFVLFAAPEYEVTINDSVAGTGHFSQALLEKLKDQPLLPDMEAIATEIRSGFLKQQKTSPSYWLKVGNNQIEAFIPRLHSPLQNLREKFNPFGEEDNRRRTKSPREIEREQLTEEYALLSAQYEAESEAARLTTDPGSRIKHAEKAKKLLKQMKEIDIQLNP